LAELTRRRGATGASSAVGAGGVSLDAFGEASTLGAAALVAFVALVALVALVAFVALGAFSGSSGWTSRRNPSASAFLRTRSACASSIEEEWLLTPIPRSTAKSTVSLFVRPSSRASS